MRRDGTNILQNETFGVVFDTFYDKRNGFVFYLTPLAGLMDIQFTDEGDSNRDWNTVWDARTGKFENGWTVEMVIPFRSLRYNPGPNQVWGINLRRIVRWKNEASYLTRVPAFLTNSGIFQISLGATLIGLEVPSGGLNLEVKPYVISGRPDRPWPHPPTKNDPSGDFGFDAKYGVTKSLTADFTYNTDFAQVEDDEQQVNLTRFNLYFPEKREFFLEGQGSFSFGTGGATSVGGGGGSRGSGGSNVPILFFSRRIGLNNGKPVPILAGGRLTGKAGRYTVGALNIESEDDEASSSVATNFTALRVKRDVSKRSYVGGIYTRRSVTTTGAGAGETFGVDALYSKSTSFNVTTYVARTRAPDKTGRDTSYRAYVDYGTDRYAAQFERPVRRHELLSRGRVPAAPRLCAQLRPAPVQPAAGPHALEGDPEVQLPGHVRLLRERGGPRRDARRQGRSASRSRTATAFSVQHTESYEFIPAPFDLAGVTVPVGG